MISPVLIDTGPIVAILNRRDSAHDGCCRQLQALAPPLLTTWPVITEAAYLLRSNPALVAKLISSLDGELWRLARLDESDGEGMARILVQYKDQKFQLADLSLMHLANRETIDTVFTLDRTDFSVFIKADSTSLKILPEAGT